MQCMRADTDVEIYGILCSSKLGLAFETVIKQVSGLFKPCIKQV